MNIYAHCQMNENQCSNYAVHMVLILKILKMGPGLFSDSIAAKNDHFTDALFGKEVAHGSDMAFISALS